MRDLTITVETFLKLAPKKFDNIWQFNQDNMYPQKRDSLVASNNLLTKVRLPFMTANTEDNEGDDDNEE